MKSFFKIFLCVFAIWIAIEVSSGKLSLSLKRHPNKYEPLSNHDLEDSTESISTIPSDYSKILNLKADSAKELSKRMFHFSNTMKFRYRNPISFFVYKKQYYLQIYKMDTSYKSPLKKVIIESRSKVSQPLHITYTQDAESVITYQYKHLKPTKPENIYLKLDAQNIQTRIKNDSIAYFYSMFSKFSIQYHETEREDILGGTTEDIFASFQPIEILFLRRNNNLYMLIMSVYNNDTKYEPGILYNIVKDSQ